MGQYYYIVNLDKKEYLYSHSLNSGLKLLEIATSRMVSTLPLLMHKSDSRGGGDGNLDHWFVEQYRGRWAGDRVVFVGDYDSSELYETAEKEYKDISFGVLLAYNTWVGYEDLMIALATYGDFKKEFEDFCMDENIGGYGYLVRHVKTDYNEWDELMPVFSTETENPTASFKVGGEYLFPDMILTGGEKEK